MITCPIRKKELKEDPEELVRVDLIHHLVDQLGFPLSMITVEKAISQLAINRSLSIPERRIDILCYGKDKKGSLFPLLLIECKAESIGDPVVRQVVGYNQYIGAPFIAVANGKELKMGWLDRSGSNESATAGQYRFISTIPHYRRLLDSLAFTASS